LLPSSCTARESHASVTRRRRWAGRFGRCSIALRHSTRISRQCETSRITSVAITSR